MILADNRTSGESKAAGRGVSLFEFGPDNSLGRSQNLSRALDEFYLEKYFENKKIWSENPQIKLSNSEYFCEFRG